MASGVFRLSFYALQGLVGPEAFRAFLQAEGKDDEACKRGIESILQHIDHQRLSGARMLAVDWDGPRESWTVHLERETLPEVTPSIRLLDVMIHEAEVEAARRAFAEVVQP